MQHTHTRAALIRLVQAALIAALYTVYTVLIQPAGFGAVQFRVSEAFTILPVFTLSRDSPSAAWFPICLA
mgnify:CR=1 FL=1